MPKMIAVHTIHAHDENGKLKVYAPGAEFDIKSDDAHALIASGAAKAFTKEEAAKVAVMVSQQPAPVATSPAAQVQSDPAALAAAKAAEADKETAALDAADKKTTNDDNADLVGAGSINNGPLTEETEDDLI